MICASAVTAEIVTGAVLLLLLIVCRKLALFVFHVVKSDGMQIEQT